MKDKISAMIREQASSFENEDIRDPGELAEDIRRALKSYREFVSEWVNGCRGMDGEWEIDPHPEWKRDLDIIDAMLSILPEENDLFKFYRFITTTRM